MYQPAHFVEQDPEALLALMQAAPLATLVRGGAELAADILPLEVERVGDGWRLTGHVARANPLWREADGQPVLAVFQGPQAYVSPSWYAEQGRSMARWCPPGTTPWCRRTARCARSTTRPGCAPSSRA